MLDGIRAAIDAHGVGDVVASAASRSGRWSAFAGDRPPRRQELGAADARAARRPLQRLDVHLRPAHRRRHRPRPSPPSTRRSRRSPPRRRQPLLAGPPVQPVFRAPSTRDPGPRRRRRLDRRPPRPQPALRSAPPSPSPTPTRPRRARRRRRRRHDASPFASTARRLRRRRRRQPHDASRRARPRAALAAGARVLVEKPLAARAPSWPRSTLAASGSWSATTCGCTSPSQRLVDSCTTGTVGRVSSRAAVVRQLAARLATRRRLPDDVLGTGRARRWRAPRRDPRARPAGLAASATATSTSSGAVVGRARPARDRRRGHRAARCCATPRVRRRVSLDYLSRAYRRGIEVVGDEATIRLDWARAGHRDRGRATHVDESAAAARRRVVRARGRALPRVRRDGTPPPVDGAAGGASLRLAERSARASR